MECGSEMDLIFVGFCFFDFHAVILMASSSNKESLSGKQLNYGAAACDSCRLCVCLFVVVCNLSIWIWN